ncbi:zf-HC2 domain-containing protein [Engelhardtia mirabilis]|uniref:Putative zinc-finger domain-containing protein n=1 Tax=Engelhardtia mirabilis TaxID=2528011 RepID=A0A518BK39_9BACT|nr:hypothetical protein Pla133_24210 [Planctomycetes bacterium Pla133]QDV01665.1 hypothetical protein Pla86_24200 [Planctomycetes bacterium Pla86]
MDTETYDCERASDLVHLYVGGDLEPAEERAVDAHLARCEPCRDAEAEARRLRQIYFEASAASGTVADLWPGIRRALLAEGRLADRAAAERAGASRSEAGHSDPAHLQAAPSEPEQPITEPEQPTTGRKTARIHRGSPLHGDDRRAPRSASKSRSDGAEDLVAAAFTGDVAGSTSIGIGGRVLGGRFGGGAAAIAAVLVAVIGVQLLFGSGDASLGVQDGSTGVGDVAELQGSVDVGSGGGNGAIGGPAVGDHTGSALADLDRGANAGLRPINRDERLLESSSEILVPVRGYPTHLVPTGPESLASYR